MDANLRRLLEATNPWLADPSAWSRWLEAKQPAQWVPRRAREPLLKALENPRKVHLVTGPRQAGKSSLILDVMQERKTPPLYLNCEEPLLREWLSSPAMVAAELPEWVEEGGVVFLEEVQWVDEAGLLLKGLVDAATQRTLVATGSASFHLASRTRESLAGRATRHRLFPLSLAEVEGGSSDGPAAARRIRLRKALDRMLLYGGFPEAWTSDEPETVLRQLLEAFVLRDASDRFRITRPDALRRLMRLCAGQTGDLVNVSEWSRVLGISTSTVSDYIDLMEEAHVLVQVRPFAGGRRSELTRAPKIYWLDNGLRNATAGGFLPWEERTDRGALMENWVFSELHKRFPEPGDIRFWRTRGGAEVDFVLEARSGRRIGIEVKAGRRPTGGSIGRGAQSFLDAYEPDEFWIVHAGEEAERSHAGTRIQWVHAPLLPNRLDTLAP